VTIVIDTLGGNAFGFYSQVAKHVSEALKHPVIMIECYSVVEECPVVSYIPLNIIEKLRIDFSFLCGGRYVVWRSSSVGTKATPLQLVAAPVRSHERYQSAPVYFADFIARREAKDTQLSDLNDIITRIREDSAIRIAYNEAESLSGYQLPLSYLKSKGYVFVAGFYFFVLYDDDAMTGSMSIATSSRLSASKLDLMPNRSKLLFKAEQTSLPSIR